MKTLVVKIPEALAAEIEAEARSTGASKSDVVRRRLERTRGNTSGPRPLTVWDLSHDLIEKLERENTDTRVSDVARHKKEYLRKWGYGQNKRHP